MIHTAMVGIATAAARIGAIWRTVLRSACMRTSQQAALNQTVSMFLARTHTFAWLSYKTDAKTGGEPRHERIRTPLPQVLRRLTSAG